MRFLQFTIPKYKLWGNHWVAFEGVEAVSFGKYSIGRNRNEMKRGSRK
jgi:hypothetical protein